MQVFDGSAEKGSKRDSDSATSSDSGSDSGSDGGHDAEEGVPEFVFAGKSVSTGASRPAARAPVRKRPQVSAASSP